MKAIIFLKWFLFFRDLVNKNLNTVLAISVLVGLFFPGVEHIPDLVVPYILGVMVFFLCAKISIAEIQHLPIFEALLFYVLRFIVFPVALYFVALAMIPVFATGILLIALMPVGVTTPALVGVLNGKIALAFMLTVFSSLLAPLIIPLVFLVSGESNNIEVKDLSYTLFSVIFIPSLLYYGLTKWKPRIKPTIASNSSFMPVLLLGCIIAIVIAKQKETFFTDFLLLINSAFVCVVLFFLMYLFGWLYRGSKIALNDESGNEEIYIKRVTYALCSGANNNALAISLALIYFPSETIFFVIVSELIWVVSIPIFNSFQKYQER